ncbi:MAG: hypothetical protein OES47_15060 [Acidobacteriota bacterium]|nr:hypothetical protein [Acidobacteriota bacterium]
MSPSGRAPDITPEPPAADDPALDAALKKVLAVIYKDHPLTANQILVLASELQRIGVHRLVEEHLRKYRRQDA